MVRSGQVRHIVFSQQLLNKHDLSSEQVTLMTVASSYYGIDPKNLLSPRIGDTSPRVPQENAIVLVVLFGREYDTTRGSWGFVCCARGMLHGGKMGGVLTDRVGTRLYLSLCGSRQTILESTTTILQVLARRDTHCNKWQKKQFPYRNDTSDDSITLPR